MEQDIQEILFSQEALARRVKELAGEIRRDYAGKAPLVVGVLRGCFVFMADLVRELDFPLTLDFMAASSYHGTESSGKVNIQLDLHDDIAGRDVLLVEDILDTGNTLSKLVAELKSRNPASLKLCVLLDKPERRVMIGILPIRDIISTSYCLITIRMRVLRHQDLLYELVCRS